ncbi:radical SAM protein [Methanopyrus sp. SNP6]|uniref:radical SAM protein n=1 Tax=Methanopyrus sp. SNP6 TaxID=1937005 RepID=UPI001F0257A5|nr:radical SAM protein [Methanopyrus sp. SNP6]
MAILDGYTDEPAGLGVPPYLGTHPRYAYGAARAAGATEVRYVPIERVRSGDVDLNRFDVVVGICGVHTPGKYLGARPADLSEMLRILIEVDAVTVLGGPAAQSGHGRVGGKLPETEVEGVDIIARGDVEAVVYDLVSEGSPEAVDPDRRRSIEELREYSVKGALAAREHLDYPDAVIAELETYRGCPRFISGGCSFCTEVPRYGKPDFRPPEDVVEEVKALYRVGVRRFRVGRQPCVFSYMAEGIGETERPRPNPEALGKLFRGICTVAPDLVTLHVDNANPAVIAEHPVESREIAKVLVRYGTPGNVVAFGVETFDERVARKNNLNVESKEEVFRAIEVVTSVGGHRGWNGMPYLLPGLNFVCGLIGEDRERYRRDEDVLREMVKRGLRVRRINVRNVVPFPGTKMEEHGTKWLERNRERVTAFKRFVREEVDPVLLRRVLPKGTVLRRLRVEPREPEFARQVGSYPVACRLLAERKPGEWIDGLVVGHRARSVEVIPIPIRREDGPDVLAKLPGVGDREALDAFLKGRRPRVPYALRSWFTF